jgi:hypothetical protein
MSTSVLEPGQLCSLPEQILGPPSFQVIAEVFRDEAENATTWRERENALVWVALAMACSEYYGEKLPLKDSSDEA